MEVLVTPEIYPGQPSQLESVHNFYNRDIWIRDIKKVIIYNMFSFLNQKAAIDLIQLL